ncbi:MAG: tetratricopeptide repeat protein [Gammaproteobacteria bacterium]|nr:hypothetical protein [Gammaproteobacteria bacterium]
MSVAVDEQAFWLGDCKVEPILNRIVRDGESIKVDPRSMEVLQLLASRPGHVFSQTEIERAVWSNVIVTPNSVYQSIAQLRRALSDDANNPRYIKTIPRKGYQLIAEVQRARLVQTAKPVNSSTIKRISREWFSRVMLLTVIPCSAVVGATIVWQPSTDTLKVSSQPSRAILTLEGLPEKTRLDPWILYQVASVALADGRPHQAREHLLNAIAIERARVGERHQNVGKLLSALANTYVWESDYDAAEAAARAAVEAFAQTSELHPDRIWALAQLGYVLLESGDLEAAEPRILEALVLASRVFGLRSLIRARILDDVAMLRFGQERLREAEEAEREALEIAMETRADAHIISRQHTILGRILLGQGRFEEARIQAMEATALLADVRRDHPLVVSARDLLAKALVGTGDYAGAEVLLRENVQLWQHSDAWSQRVWASTSALGESLLAQGRIDEAEKCLHQASLNLGKSAALQERLWYQEHLVRLDKLQAAKSKVKIAVHDS